MRTTRTIPLLALGAALLLDAGTVAGAQPPARARGGQRALFRGIDLSLAQRRQLRDIGLKYGDQREDMLLALRKQAGAAQGQRPDSATRARLRTQLQTQKRALMDRQLADQRTVLTPEQRTAFDRNVAQLRERMQARADRVRTRTARGGMMRRRGLAPGAYRPGAYRPGAYGRGYARAFDQRAFERRARPGAAFRDRAYWRGE